MRPSPADPPGLQCHVVDPFHRRWHQQFRRWWLAGASGAVAVLAIAMLRSISEPPRLELVLVPGPSVPGPSVPGPVVLVPAPPVATPTLAAAPARDVCPAPMTSAPSSQITFPADEITALRPSPSDARWIAAWTWNRAFVSLDGGHSWREVLDGPYPLLVLGDAAYRVRGPHGKTPPRATRLPIIVAGHDPIADASGRIWTVHCNALRVATATGPTDHCED